VLLLKLCFALCSARVMVLCASRLGSFRDPAARVGLSAGPCCSCAPTPSTRNTCQFGAASCIGAVSSECWGWVSLQGEVQQPPAQAASTHVHQGMQVELTALLGCVELIGGGGRAARLGWWLHFGVDVWPAACVHSFDCWRRAFNCGLVHLPAAGLFASVAPLLPQARRGAQVAVPPPNAFSHHLVRACVCVSLSELRSMQQTVVYGHAGVCVLCFF
jgi:hypothetical protein